MLKHPADAVRDAPPATTIEKHVPSSRDAALVGRVMPEMQLSSVLLPAPFGPISPTIDPAIQRELYIR